MSSRRRAVRRPRRVQVHFWKYGDPTAYTGYTTNISLTGMFIATNSPVASGSRIRVEVIDRDRGFAVEGLVAHARKMQPELARLNQSGMGVRFLSVEELVRELIPSGLGETEGVPHDVTRAEPVAPPSFVMPPHVTPPPFAPPPARPRAASAAVPPKPPAVTPPAAAPPRPPAAAPPKPSAAAAPRPPAPAKPVKPAVPVAPSGGSYTVRFSGVDEFLDVYKRDILQGGLFVSTLYPARLQETVNVEMYPPGPFTQPVMVRARVVQRFEPNLDAGPNLLSGMGLELLELPELVQRLELVVARLKGR